MKIRLGVRILLFLCLLIGETQAQEEKARVESPEASPDLRIASMRVAIWPEYDDPRVLIILRGTFSSPSAFPATVRFTVPDDLHVIGAGMVSEQGELLLHPHQVIREKDKSVLSFLLPRPQFFVEYYYSPFYGATERRFTFSLPTDYPADEIEVHVQQPLRSTNFRTDPAPSETQTDAQGFTYHVYRFQQVAADQSIPIQVTYHKEDTTPSMPKKALPPPQDPPAPAIERTPSPVAMPSAQRGISPSQIFFVVLLSIGVLLLVYLYCFGLPKTGKLLLRNRPDKDDDARIDLIGYGKRFCTQCGQRLHDNFRYCPRCGQQL